MNNQYLASTLCVSVLLIGLTTAGSASANLIKNSSFEDVSSAATGQGIMPSEWVKVNVSPDTYSNDGSYGLAPYNFNNFTGVTAYDGIKWVAGWSEAGQERFGQNLTATLSEGSEYTMSGFLHQANRSDLNNPGGYELYLTDFSYDLPSSGEYLGFLGQTSSVADGWLEYSFVFTATTEMADLSFLMFAPTGPNAYPGLDNVSLTVSAVPAPAAIWLLGFGLIGLIGLTKYKKRNVSV